MPGLAGHLTDIEHIVLLMQENRSFDHYFGRLSGTHGFNDSSPLFQQKGWNPRTASLDPAGITLPYRFDTTRGPLLSVCPMWCREPWATAFPIGCPIRRRCPCRGLGPPAGFPAASASGGTQCSSRNLRCVPPPRRFQRDAEGEARSRLTAATLVRSAFCGNVHCHGKQNPNFTTLFLRLPYDA